MKWLGVLLLSSVTCVAQLNPPIINGGGSSSNSSSGAVSSVSGGTGITVSPTTGAVVVSLSGSANTGIVTNGGSGTNNTLTALTASTAALALYYTNNSGIQAAGTFSGTSGGFVLTAVGTTFSTNNGWFVGTQIIFTNVSPNQYIVTSIDPSLTFATIGTHPGLAPLNFSPAGTTITIYTPAVRDYDTVPRQVGFNSGEGTIGIFGEYQINNSASYMWLEGSNSFEASTYNESVFHLPTWALWSQAGNIIVVEPPQTVNSIYYAWWLMPNGVISSRFGITNYFGTLQLLGNVNTGPLTGTTANFSTSAALNALTTMTVKITNGLQFTSGAGAGKYLTSDASGNGTWNTLTGPIAGITSGVNASAGNVGEVISATVPSTSPTSLGNGTANAIQVSLTAGDWDVSGNLNIIASTATITYIVAGITNGISAVIPTDGTEVNLGWIGAALSGTNSVILPPKRINIASTSTAKLVVIPGFSAGTLQLYGSIRARRVD